MNKQIIQYRDDRLRVFVDTEFYEDGSTIDLISIGAARSDGAEFYAVSRRVWHVTAGARREDNEYTVWKPRKD
jgi:hypothetical protein